MKTLKALKTVFKGLAIGILSLALLLNAAVLVKRLVTKEKIPLVMGFGNAVVITGSMKPAINEGDVIIIRKQDAYAVQDIVAYRTANTPVTHRIVEATDSGYITQGDANNARDKEIAQSSVIGKVVKIIPKAGNAILFFQKPMGMLILLAGLFALAQAPALLRSIRARAELRKKNAQ